MIEKLKTYQLRLPENVQFFSDAITVCKNSNPAALNIQPQFLELEKSFGPVSQSYKKDQASLLTTDLIKVDQRRDNAILFLRKQAESYTVHHDAARQKAGNKLLMAIDKYGDRIHKMNYQAETIVLEKIVNDLHADAGNAAAVKLLGVEDTVAELKAANELFNKTYLERVDEAASKDLTAAGTLLHECRVKYNTLVKHIEANATINPSDAYTALIGKLNSLIVKFNSTAEIRAGRNGKEEDMVDNMPS